MHDNLFCALSSVALSANCNCTQSEIRNMLTIHNFPTGSSEWLKVYVSVNFSIDTAISSYVWSASRTLEWLSQVLKISHPAECNCHLLYRMTSESYLMSSLPLLCLYISQCKFHISSLIPRSSSTCTACTTTYYRFFNIHMYLRTSEFVSFKCIQYLTSRMTFLYTTLDEYCQRLRC